MVVLPTVAFLPAQRVQHRLQGFAGCRKVGLGVEDVEALVGADGRDFSAALDQGGKDEGEGRDAANRLGFEHRHGLPGEAVEPLVEDEDEGSGG